MQKEWYLIYTKPKCEKKVASLLTKRKIENFYPINCRQIKDYRKNKVVYEPLFDSYVFAKMKCSETALLREFNSVINLVFWQNRPVIIREEAIKAIKEFIGNHSNIKLIKIPVEANAEAVVMDGPSYSKEGNVLTVKNRSKKVSLPALGFMMVAEIEGTDVMGRETAFGDRKMVMQ